MQKYAFENMQKCKNMQKIPHKYRSYKKYAKNARNMQKYATYAGMIYIYTNYAEICTPHFADDTCNANIAYFKSSEVCLSLTL